MADRLEKAVDAVLDAGLRTSDIFKGLPGTKLVKGSEMGAALIALM